METRRCIGYRELKTYVPLSRVHIRRLTDDPRYMRDDPFPRALRIGQCRVCWWLHEVQAWLERRSRR